MSRRRLSRKRTVNSDLLYSDKLIQMLINRIMKKGNKTLARRIIYKTIRMIEQSTHQDPVKTVNQAILNITPFVEVRSRRLGGSTTQIPVFISNPRGLALAMRWLFQSCSKKAGGKSSIVDRLSLEIINASNGIGEAIKKRDEMHKMAEANKTILRYNTL